MPEKELVDYIRTTTTNLIAILTQDILLEMDDRNKVKKIIELYELSFQLLCIYGFALAQHHNIQYAELDKIISKMKRPSMGQWFASLITLNKILGKSNRIFLFNPNHKIKGTIFEEIYQQLAELLQQRQQPKPKMIDFLSLITPFRNSYIGHGSLSKKTAGKIARGLETTVYRWVKGCPLFWEHELIYIDRIEWREPVFCCYGFNLNRGGLVDPYFLENETPIRHNTNYLKYNSELVSLYPYVEYEDESHIFYIYHSRSDEGLRLRCPLSNVSEKDIIIDEDFYTVKEMSKTQEPEMSQYHNTIYKIKNSLTENWLTRSQEVVWNKLLKVMEPPFYVVNIFGEPGTGKTFLGWLMKKKGMAKFVDTAEINWEELAGSECVVFDRYDVSRRSLRSLRGNIQNYGINQAIVLSRERAKDEIPCFELLVSSEDIDIAKANLYREFDIVVPDGDLKTLRDCYKHMEENDVQ